MAEEGAGITPTFQGFCAVRHMYSVVPYPQRARLHAQQKQIVGILRQLI